jgi:hypothetical protein
MQRAARTFSLSFISLLLASISQNEGPLSETIIHMGGRRGNPF